MSSPSGTNFSTVSISGAWRQKDVGSAKRMYRWQRWTHSAVGAKAWSIVGSNDQTTWYLVDRISNQNTNNNTINVIVNSNYSQYSYRYYRWIEEAMVSQTSYILNHFFGWYDQNNTVLTNDQTYTYSPGSGDYTIGGNSSAAFDVTFSSYNWQQSDNYNTNGSYTGSTVMIVYDPTLPQAGPPSAPTSLSASAGNQSITISFTPGSDGGSAITNYKYSINDGSSYTAFDPEVTSSPVVISNLTNGQSYSIKLLAVNTNGDGTPSNTVTATPHTVPDAPTNLVASYNGSGSVSISFTPGTNGGMTISNYQYSIDCGVSFDPLDPVDGISPITISGLTNGQTYCIELKAENTAGASIASSSVEYTASGLPDAPTNISWVDLYNGTISVSFTSGANNGSPITNYQYSVEDGANVTVLSPVDSLSPITITGLTNRTGYSLILQAINANGPGAESTPLALYYMCFLEGTKILCYDPESKQEIERPIESLRSGDLVKTTMDGYKAIDTIGTSKIYNPANSMRSKNRLYKYSKENHPELKEDLVITGCHAVLVSELSDEERRDLIDIQGKVYVTADYYRLIACVDKRSQPYEKEGLFNIWHLALENDNYYFNYGIYANGLKVETASKRMMKEMSGMDLIQ
jgi:hypothetical protein